MEQEFKLKEHPIQCPSGYSLDLYCKYDNPDHSFEEFPHGITTEETFKASVRAARQMGWLYHHKDNTATCPKCAKRLEEMKAKGRARPFLLEGQK